MCPRSMEGIREMKLKHVTLEMGIVLMLVAALAGDTCQETEIVVPVSYPCVSGFVYGVSGFFHDLFVGTLSTYA